MIDIPKNMTSIHVIDCIGQHEPINNAGIARKMNLSKANVTKISTKLIKEEFINSYQLTDNKKEVYFKLTRKGRRIFDLHKKLHKKGAGFLPIPRFIFTRRTKCCIEISRAADIHT